MHQIDERINDGRCANSFSCTCFRFRWGIGVYRKEWDDSLTFKIIQKEKVAMSTRYESQQSLSVTLLDVGTIKYGDCIFCRFGEVTVLADGAHPSDYEGG